MVKFLDIEDIEDLDKMEENFSIINKTKTRIPVLSLLAIKNKILGKNYSLSIAFVDKITSRKINKTYKNKNKATNVLSFSLSKKGGEIVICPSIIKTEVQKEKSFNKNYKEFLKFLIIHSMLHLKGMKHGSKMEKEEEKYLSHTKFSK